MHKVSDTQPWHRQFWPWFLIALPAVVVIACFYTVYLALNNPLSIVKEDYYKEGLAINQNQQRYIKAAELGLAARCLLERQYLRCELTTDTNKRDATPLQIQFMHPVNSEKDISTSLLPVDYAVFRSEPLTESVQEKLRAERRWYIYLEPVEGDWALQTESAVGEQDAIELKPGT